tara:strand:+ start:1643 stop:3058 length:1416 start_codon:yes stop_codon:yes gene_type:complete
MSYTLDQQPAYQEQPVGTDWIYTVKSSNITGNYKFKYFLDVYISEYGATYALRLKFSPNATGVGIINTSDIFEQYVKSDNLGSTRNNFQSEFKGVDNIAGSSCPIHCIDKLSLNDYAFRKASFLWGEEFSTNATDAPTEYPALLITMQMSYFNGMAYNNEQILSGGNYGINLAVWNAEDFLPTSSASKFLTDSPHSYDYNGVGINIRNGDYHTLAFLSGYFMAGFAQPDEYTVTFLDVNDSVISSFSKDITNTNGGANAVGTNYIADSRKALMYLGAGIGNFFGFAYVPLTWDSYTIMLKSNSVQVSKAMLFKREYDDCKGFETIRLTWLNKYGVWDYYNFTKKNTESTDIKRTEYNKIKGNWNSDTYIKYGYERGLTTLHTNATKKITLNSDWFKNDKEAAWLEQLFISPEVYILNGYNVHDSAPAEYGKYMQPVQITNKEYVRYTQANDKVAQYEVDIEYAIKTRVQRA